MSTGEVGVTENDELLERAATRHRLGAELAQRGQLQEAVEHLREAIRLDPQSVQIARDLRAALAALQTGRGLALQAEGRLAEAADCFREALKVEPAHVAAHGNLGNALKLQGQFADAERCYRRVLDLVPHCAQAHNDLGYVAQLQGRSSEALTSFLRAVELDPLLAEAHANLGATLAHLGRFNDAEMCCRRAIELRPQLAENHANLARVLKRLGRLDEAVFHWRRTLELNPTDPHSHFELGLTLLENSRLDEAEANFRRTVALAPGHAEAYNNLGVVLKERNRPGDSIAAFNRALELNPNYADAYNNLGVMLAEQEQIDEAIASYRRALDLRADYHRALFNLAEALLRQNKLFEGSAVCRRALELKPDDAETRFLHGVILLGMGHFAEGWQEYEWRTKTADNRDEVRLEPYWDGLPLGDRTILLRCEQGLGDAIQFLRYAELVKQQGATVVVECARSLASLAARVAGVDCVVVQGEPRPRCDVQVPLMSLPRIFGTTLETVPCHIPYLSPDPQAVNQWREDLAAPGKFKVGIAWQGNLNYRRDRLRSIPLRYFTRLARVPSVQVYSLQVGPGREQLGALADAASIVDLGDRIGDFHHTAAAMCNLDLVITSDCSTAHLAGALGLEVWVALAFAPEWRWMLERADSPWYPAMRLFRQSAAGEWEEVFRRLERALTEAVQNAG